jgi:hypothetical protein
MLDKAYRFNRLGNSCISQLAVSVVAMVRRLCLDRRHLDRRHSLVARGEPGRPRATGWALSEPPARSCCRAAGRVSLSPVTGSSPIEALAAVLELAAAARSTGLTPSPDLWWSYQQGARRSIADRSRQSVSPFSLTLALLSTPNAATSCAAQPTFAATSPEMLFSARTHLAS